MGRTSLSYQAQAPSPAQTRVAASEARKVSRSSRPIPASSASAAVATDARLGGDATRTRFILDLSRTIELTAFTLADPYRVVVDLPQVAFQLPGKAGESAADAEDVEK